MAVVPLILVAFYPCDSCNGNNDVPVGYECLVWELFGACFFLYNLLHRCSVVHVVGVGAYERCVGVFREMCEH